MQGGDFNVGPFLVPFCLPKKLIIFKFLSFSGVFPSSRLFLKSSNQPKTVEAMEHVFGSANILCCQNSPDSGSIKPVLEPFCRSFTRLCSCGVIEVLLCFALLRFGSKGRARQPNRRLRAHRVLLPLIVFTLAADQTDAESRSLGRHGGVSIASGPAAACV